MKGCSARIKERVYLAILAKATKQHQKENGYSADEGIQKLLKGAYLPPDPTVTKQEALAQPQDDISGKEAKPQTESLPDVASPPATAEDDQDADINASELEEMV